MCRGRGRVVVVGGMGVWGGSGLEGKLCPQTAAAVGPESNTTQPTKLH